MISQILRFTLPPSQTVSCPAFARARSAVAEGGPTDQYYGYTAPTSFSPLPRSRHEICWVINWPDGADRSAAVAAVNGIAAGDVTCILCGFDDTQLRELYKALESPVCEFAVIRLSDSAPLADPACQASMHKTYTDAYKILGFNGGHWTYALNTNDSAGASVSSDSMLQGEDRRLGVYFLGWDSIELHEDGTKTPEFAEEIVKLAPYFGLGTGAWYAMLRKHS